MSDFTYSGYLNLLSDLKQNGYKIGTLKDFPDSGPAVILRHDIDFSIPQALKMAKLDSQLGINSTFFVLLTSPFYNALSENNITILKEIIMLGHEIGLHYDCSAFENYTQEQMTSQISAQITILELFTEIKISSISQHKPATSKIRPRFSGFRDAYDPKYTSELAYLSDSRMQFSVKDVPDFFNKNLRSQLLIHPIWWDETRMSRREIFENLKAGIFKETHIQLDNFYDAIETYLRRK